MSPLQTGSSSGAGTTTTSLSSLQQLLTQLTRTTVSGSMTAINPTIQSMLASTLGRMGNITALGKFISFIPIYGIEVGQLFNDVRFLFLNYLLMRGKQVHYKIWSIWSSRPTRCCSRFRRCWPRHKSPSLLPTWPANQRTRRTRRQTRGTVTGRRHRPRWKATRPAPPPTVLPHPPTLNGSKRNSVEVSALVLCWL